jgi:hypothetical protein
MGFFIYLCPMAGWKFYLNNIQVAEPIGFDAIEFTAKRLPSYGIDSPFSTELTFTGKAANLIKAEYDVHYINAEITILIQSDVNVNGSAYAFNGFLNLSIYSEKNVCDTNGFEVTVGIIEDNFREQFLSRQDVELDLTAQLNLDQNPIDPINFREILLHCQELYLIGNARPLIVDADSGESAGPDNVVVPLYWQNSDFKGQYGNTINPTGYIFNNFNVIFQNNDTITRTFNVCGQIRSTCYFLTDEFPYEPAGPFPISLELYIFDEDHNIFSNPDLDVSSQFPFFGPADPFVLEYQFNNYTITLPPGYSFTFAITKPSYDWSLILCNFLQSENFITLSEISSTEFASNVSLLTTEDFLRRAIWLITGDPDGLISDTFSESGEGCFWNHCLTTGLYIRNAQTIQGLQARCGGDPTEDFFLSIKTTFKKIFDGLNRIFCLGWQFEQDVYGSWKLRVEKADYFFNTNTVIQSFPKVGQIMQSAMSDKLVNNIKLGYSDKFKNIAISAFTEINADRNYFIGNKARVDNSSVSLDLLSDIIGSGYAIEFYRRLQFLRDDSGSSDRPNDYDLFIIWVNRYEVTVDLDTDAGQGYRLEGETGSKTFAPGTVSYGSNFIAESNGPIDRVYNVFNSPARIAARWWKILGMHTYGLPTAKAILAFQVGQYFTDYSSRIDSTSEPEECMEVINGASDVLFENTNIGPDILVPGEAEYLMKPITVEFDAPQTLCSFIDMSYNGNGLVRVTSGSLELFGFIEDATNKPQDPNSGISTLKLTLANKIGEGRAFSDGFSDGFG